MNIPDFDLEIPFKGNRNYLHSTDLYNAFFSTLENYISPDKIKNPFLLFKRIINQPVQVTFKDFKGEYKARFSLDLDKITYRAHVFERQGNVSQRIPYSEEKITSNCQLNLGNKSILINHDQENPYSIIESIVAANKKLHLTLFDKYPGKWLFTEVKSTIPLYEKPWTKIEVRLESNLSTKLTKSIIFVDEINLGHICFSLLKSTA